MKAKMKPVKTGEIPKKKYKLTMKKKVAPKKKKGSKTRIT